MNFISALTFLLSLSIFFNTIIAIIFPKIFFWNKEGGRRKNFKQGVIAFLTLFILSIFFAGLSKTEIKVSDTEWRILNFIFLGTLSFPIFSFLVNKFQRQEIQTKTNQEGRMFQREIIESSGFSQNSSITSYKPILHPDLEGLIWFGDGPFKNYSPSPSDVLTIDIRGIRMMIQCFYQEEPSLIYINQKISKPTDISKVERPPYFPSYKGLSPEQKWIYLKFLTNPYDNSIDIGYVFILYYGLERHLLKGEYEKAFRVILKLRDVHNNRSFQYYSANALVLSAMLHERGDLVSEFIESLDKEYEFMFSDNLFLICYYSFDKPIKPYDIVRMAKSFDFTKRDYIKKYPDVFIDILRKVLLEKFGTDGILLKNLISDSDLSHIKYTKEQIFANVSLSSEEIKVPNLLQFQPLRKLIYDILDETHNRVKEFLFERRKIGKPIPEKKVIKPQKILVFDAQQESSLLKQLEKAKNALERHFIYIYLQDFYYKYRNLDKKYIEKCKEYCWKDINSLEETFNEFLKQESERIKSLENIYGKEQVDKEIEKIEKEGFYGTIPAFSRLLIIYEKEEDIENAIKVCELALQTKYFRIEQRYFEEKMKKLEKKLKNRI